MSYNFISDFINFAGESECPKNYIKWASLFPLSCAAGRRYYTEQARLVVTPELCLVFIGPSSNKKSHAKDLAKAIVVDALPELTIAADITSKDDLTRLICSADSTQWFVNYEGAECESHPVCLFVDEIRHFMSYSPSAMIAFLVDVYGKKYYKSTTLKRGLEEAVEPIINFLGCTTQDWIVENLKSGILSGGWSRRFITIYEPRRTTTPIDWPMAPPDSKFLSERMKNHLRKIQAKAGIFTWRPDAREYFREWYSKNFFTLPDDIHLQSYFANKDKHLIKVCECIALADEEPVLEFTKPLLETGLAFFEAFEENLPKLYLSGGRNELAIHQLRIIELIEANDGGLEKKDLLRKTAKDFSPMEQISTIKFLQESGQISPTSIVKMPDGKNQEMVMLPWKFNLVKSNNGKWL